MSAGLHNYLRTVRTRLGLTQQELARAAHVTRQTIGGIEAGLYSPSAAVAMRLARALGCRVEDLFWLEEDLPILAVDLAQTADSPPDSLPSRLAVARVGQRWIAYPLHGEQAFRLEMVPADGFAAAGDLGAQASRLHARSVGVRLLDDPEVLERTVAVAGCSASLSLWARAAERWYPGLRVHWIYANSTLALQSLARGEVHAAGLHLSDPESDEDNAPYLRRAIPDRDVVLVHLGVWEEGLIVARGNPHGLRRAADLARPGLRLVNREPGSGARQLLETSLAVDGVPTAAVQGFEHVVPTHFDVAREVASGGADVSVTSASVAWAFGLDFVPLRQVRYDLALLRESLEHEPVRQLLGTLDHRRVRSQLESLGGYDTARTGEIVGETGVAQPGEIRDMRPRRNGGA